ncbi:hypothetical protein [Desulfomicrobium salsuginis]
MTTDPARNETRPRPTRPLRRIAAALCLLAGVAAVLLVVLWAALPRLAEGLLLPVAAERLGVPGLAVDIRRVGLSGLDLGTISLGPDAGLEASAVQADWSLSGLARGRADTVRVMGLRVTITEKDGVWVVRGLPRAAAAAGSGPSFLPQIDALSVDGVVELDGQATDLRLPVNLEGSLGQDGLAVLEARTELAGQTLRLTVRADLARGDVRLTCSLPPASLAALASLVPGLRDLPVSGTLEALAEAALPPEGPPQAQARLDLRSVQAVPGQSPITQDGGTSLRLDWREAVGITLDPVRLRAPLPLVLTISDINMNPEAGALDCGWEATLAAVPGLRLASPLRLAGTTSARRTPHGWDLRSRGRLDPVQAAPENAPDLKATVEACTVDLAVSSSAGATRIDASLDLGKLQAARGDIKGSLSGLGLVCNATADAEGLTGNLSLSGGRLEARRPSLTLNTTRLEGACTFAFGPEPTLAGSISVGLAAGSGDATATMALRLPLAWPDPATEAGSLSVDLGLKKRSVAKISSRIAQNLHGLALEGTLSVPPLAVRASLKGRADLANPRASWLEAKADQTVTLPGDLPRFVPALTTLGGSARLQASARLDLERGTAAIPAALKLTGIALTHGKAKAALSGGALAVAFSDALTMRSDPDQRLTFERLQLGEIILEKGDVRYQVEAPHSILVEGCSFRWAGGRIGTQAFRLNPGVEDYTVEMYCDRVELPKALGQLGMTRASGGGTANGRIPVRWAGGRLTFDNGFLYSTPGEKGVLRIEGTEILTAGVPPGTPQYGQLDLASEALKDFGYEWAKVNMNTVDGELVVSLQLDGKPEKPLPFVYDREFGGFARVSASSPGSVFQGIRLDVNFRLPLDQLLQYRQILELINNGG